MDNFEALIKAILDTTDIPRQIDEISKNHPLALVIDQKKLVNDIESALKHPFNININPVVNTGGKNGGKGLAKTIKTDIETSISKSTVDVDLKNLLNVRGIDKNVADNILDSFRKDIDKTIIKLEALDAQFEETKKNGKKLKSVTFTGLDDEGKRLTITSKADKKTGKFNTTITKVKQNFNQAAKEVTQKSSEVFDELSKIQNKINSLNVDKAKLNPEINTEQIAELERQIGNLIAEYARLLDVSGDDLSQDQFDKLSKSAQAGADKLKLLSAKFNDIENSVTELDVMTLDNKMKTWLEKNSRAAKEFGDDIESLRKDLKELWDGNNLSSTKFDEIIGKFKGIEQSAKAAGLTGKSFGERLKSAFQGLAGYFTIENILERTIDLLRDMYNEVYEIDTAMVNLKKVTEETEERYDSFLRNSAESARELGRSVSSLVEQTATWSKLGYTLDEAENLAKLSSIYANVAEVDDATAVSDMVTAMKAFNIEAKNAISVIDPLNELGNRFATDAAALGDGLSRSASAMSAAGTDMYKTLAMLTGITEITQNASEAGNFLKVASMRIRGMKGELEELGEEVDSSVDSISKVQTQILNLTHGKVNIFDDAGEFRDYYEIMKDIADVYDRLSSTERASLTEILFGKMRGNQGQALIQGFKTGQIEKAYSTALNSAGSAAEEQAHWMEGLEAKVQQFKAVWQDLSMAVLNSDFLKSAIDLGTDFVGVLADMIENLGVIPTLIAGIGIGGGFTALKENLD